MEYIYAAMLLHQAGKPIDETNINKILESTGVTPDVAKTKSLVASLEGVDIEQAIKEATTVQVAPANAEGASADAGGGAEKKKDEPSEEDKKKNEEQATAGLGALFG